MKCLLIFDHLNDLVYSKYNKKFLYHIKDLAVAQELLKDEEAASNSRIGSNILVQIFSPIIASQRIMTCQFGNSYTSVQCEDDVTMSFDEYMGYLFVAVGRDDVSKMKKYLSVCVTIVRYFCGPDILQLKDKPGISYQVSSLIESWTKLYENDQAILLEAVEQLIVNADLSSTTIRALRDSVGKLTTKIGCAKIHALVMVQNKFLSLYSSQSAKELSPTDIIFITILCHSSAKKSKRCIHRTNTGPDSDQDLYSPVLTSPRKHEYSDGSTSISSYKVLLAGLQYSPQCLPYIVHIVQPSEGIDLVYLVETGNAAVSSSVYETFCHFHTLQFVQIQRNVDTMRPALENLDIATRRLCDSLKKTKNGAVEACYKQLLKKWEITRKKYQEFVKGSSDEALLRGETLALGFLENLKQLLGLTVVEEELAWAGQGDVAEVAGIVVEKLRNFDEFLKVKAIKNFSLGSTRDSLTINKYLEEFPGLVHFIYVDRNNHRITSPTLDFTVAAEESIALTKNKIWEMVTFAWKHLQDGTLSLIWKDTVFSYSYFLWFEDASGAPLKPTVAPENTLKGLPIPGLFCFDFYHKLKEYCFPKTSPAKIRCYELFCVHLGLVTAPCVLEHTRRLAATVWELKGHPNHPIDIL